LPIAAEIACRIARTARRLGLAVATVHSDADAGALHVRDIGESHRLGAAPAGDSYLNIDAVLAAARRAGADAIHPGYGFLSENAALPVRWKPPGWSSSARVPRPSTGWVARPAPSERRPGWGCRWCPAATPA
jgi:biotin carboxylase